MTGCGLFPDDDKAGGPALTEPVGVTAQAGSATSVHVMWNRPVSTTDVTGYEVYRGSVRVKELSAEQHMVDVTGLRAKSRYEFTVRARGKDGSLGPASRRVTVTTPAAVAADGSAPSRPEGLRGHVDGGRAVTLSWRKAADDRSVVSYDIYQGTTKIHSVGGTQTRALLTGLRPGTAYKFSVRARDAADNVSAASDPVRLTTARGKNEGPGTAPDDFRATTRRADGAYYIDLAWTPPETGGEVPAYQVFLDGEQATTVMWGESAPPDAAKYSFYIGKDAGARHRVKIRGQLPDGTWGAFSPERTVTTGG
ncbi:fibronectin type III domain-containing protein [Streptomyces kunmingensis]|uniref:Fibronectin type III domain-containing protein n=1 Tax=Streptomyces kunmingensis TaxID=68225 RepID=A0ABU6CA25_9ACTN|nr:fibronectin type III domain-containing protein [Streptomyces kunmingensis]MEB3961559.1 fibronectin type III domain-containing protein [Streptomyces kunmingensis]